METLGKVIWECATLFHSVVGLKVSIEFGKGEKNIIAKVKNFSIIQAFGK